jgi:hypothetical protein
MGPLLAPEHHSNETGGLRTSVTTPSASGRLEVRKAVRG